MRMAASCQVEPALMNEMLAEYGPLSGRSRGGMTSWAENEILASAVGPETVSESMVRSSSWNELACWRRSRKLSTSSPRR